MTTQFISVGINGASLVLNFFSPLITMTYSSRLFLMQLPASIFIQNIEHFLLTFLFFMVDNVLIGLPLHHFFFQSNISTMCSVY